MQYDFRKEKIYIAMGTVDDESVVGELPQLGEHIYVGKGEHASWEVQLDDGVNRMQGIGVDFEREVSEYRQKLKKRK